MSDFLGTDYLKVYNAHVLQHHGHDCNGVRSPGGLKNPQRIARVIEVLGDVSIDSIDGCKPNLEGIAE